LQARGKIAHTNSSTRLSLYNGYFSLPLENKWTAPEVDPPEDDEPAMQWILDTINGANNTCAPISINYTKPHSNMRPLGSKCATPGGLMLLTEASTRTFPFSFSHTSTF
jgi:hypothetical protein